VPPRPAGGRSDQGVAILFVSHFLDQVYAISDRITVLRNGRFVGEYLKRELDRTQLISKMIGKDLDALRALGSNRQVDVRDRTATPVYAAEGIGRKIGAQWYFAAEEVLARLAARRRPRGEAA
jgi:ABC-type sugar transport system ATPase subunit